MTSEGSGDLANATLRDLLSGQKLFGRYTLVKILGRGGMGIVWLARDEKPERDQRRKVADRNPCNVHTLHASSYG